MPTEAKSITRSPVLIDLALQGGGSHGAFRARLHRSASTSYLDIVVGGLLALAVVIILGTTVGYF